MTCRNNGADILANEIEPAVLQCADIDDHINFRSTVGNGLPCFGSLDAGFVCAQGKADDGCRFDAAAFELPRNEGNVAWIDTNTCKMVLLCLAAEAQ